MWRDEIEKSKQNCTSSFAMTDEDIYHSNRCTLYYIHRFVQTGFLLRRLVMIVEIGSRYIVVQFVHIWVQVDKNNRKWFCNNADWQIHLDIDIKGILQPQYRNIMTNLLSHKKLSNWKDSRNSRNGIEKDKNYFTQVLNHDLYQLIC